MSNVAQKLFFLALGGTIGAAVALLLAPKSGKELRSDIATLTGRGYEEALAATNEFKERTAEYFENAKETGAEVLHVVSDGMCAVGDEVRHDARKINRIFGGVRHGSRSDQVL